MGCSTEDIEAPPAPADRLEFRVGAAQAVAGLALDPAVQVVVLRADGTLDVTSSALVSLTTRSASVTDTIRGVSTVAAVAGVATFPAVSLLRTSADTRLVARTAGLTGAESAAIRIVHGEATQLAFLTQPDAGVAGQPLAPLRVQLRDIGGNRVASANAPITVSIATGPAGASVAGTVTANLVSGEATFDNLRLPRAGTGYTLSAALLGNSAVASPVTRVFITAPAAAAELTFVSEPTASSVGFPITPQVRVAVLDSFGNTVTTATAPVILELAVAAAGAQLTGVTTVAATAGVATFANLRVDRPSAITRLRASAPGLTAAISAAFTVGVP